MLAPRSARGWALLVAALVLVLLLASAAVGIIRTRESQSHLESLHAQSESASSIERARGDFLNATGSLAAVVLAGDSDRYYQYQFYMLAAEANLQSASKIIAAQGRTADAEKVDSIAARLEEFSDVASSSATAYIAGDTGVVRQVQEQMTELASQIAADLTSAAVEERSAVAAEKSALEGAFNATLFITIALGVAGLAIAGLAMTALVLVVVRPLTGLGLSARSIAAGDLERRARVTGPSEVRSLATEFNRMTETLVSRNRDLEGARAQLELLNQSLESRVQERTESLSRIAEELTAEIEDRKAAQETVRHLAYYDTLSGLPNRILFVDRLKQAIAGARRSGKMVAVILLDLDRFKDVNDSVGHAEGDRLLKKVGARLKTLLRSGDTLARFGGDEFVLVIPGIADADEAVVAAQRVLTALRKPWKVNDREFYMPASIGISLAPFDGDDPDTLLRNADTAMYRAKEHGRNAFELYAPEMNARIAERLSLEHEIRRALSNSEFTVYYQPQVEVATGRIVGVEALVRWQHPERGLVLPGEFISVAESAGLIVPLDDWVMRRACEDGRAWLQAGLPPIRIAVNLSARQFEHRNLAEKIATVLNETGMDPHLLQVEITERVAMTDIEGTMKTLTRLREMGLQVAIDDFGTGHSSLSYMKRLPIDTVKIDRSFICDLSAGSVDAALVSAIIFICHSMKITVIAEGVETADQLDVLRNPANAVGLDHDERCDEFQGFLFSYPLPAPELEALLSGRRSPSRSLPVRA